MSTPFQIKIQMDIIGKAAEYRDTENTRSITFEQLKKACKNSIRVHINPYKTLGVANPTAPAPYQPTHVPIPKWAIPKSHIPSQVNPTPQIPSQYNPTPQIPSQYNPTPQVPSQYIPAHYVPAQLQSQSADSSKNQIKK